MGCEDGVLTAGGFTLGGVALFHGSNPTLIASLSRAVMRHVASRVVWRESRQRMRTHYVRLFHTGCITRCSHQSSDATS